MKTEVNQNPLKDIMLILMGYPAIEALAARNPRINQVNPLSIITAFPRMKVYNGFISITISIP